MIAFEMLLRTVQTLSTPMFCSAFNTLLICAADFSLTRKLQPALFGSP